MAKPIHWPFHWNKRDWRWGVTAIAVVAAITVVVVVAVLAPKGDRDDGSYAVIYSKGGNLQLQNDGGGAPLRTAKSQRQVFSGDRKTLYYDAATEDGLALYRLDLSKSKSREDGGTRVAPSIQPDWTAGTDGRYVTYIETKGKILRCYDSESGNAAELSAGVAALYASPGLPVFFFCKTAGEQKLLFRCQLGEKPEQVAGGVDEVHYFADGKRSLIFFTSVTGESTKSLSVVGETGGVTMITQDPLKIFFDQYELGGNLYFLQKGTDAAGVSVLVEDPQQTADALLKEPKREDYFSGIITSFLGDRAYEKDYQAYQEKLERDTLRAEVKRALEALPNQVTQQDCYAFNGVASYRLAGPLTEESILRLQAMGTPRCIYDKWRVTAGDSTKTVTLEELASLRRKGGADAVAKRLNELAEGSRSYDGRYLIQLTSAGPYEILLEEEENGRDRSYAFLRKPEALFCLEREEQGKTFVLYRYDITEFGVSERKTVDTGVMDLLPAQEGAYYRKQEPGAELGSLFYAGDGKPQKLCTGVEAFFLIDSGLPPGEKEETAPANELIALCEVQGGMARAYYCAKGEARLISNSLKMDTLRYARGAVFYLSNPQQGAYECYRYAIRGGKHAIIDTSVTEILVAA
ncbi:MAG: hypothetical protein LBJ11_10775 [Oscillospiraceae bacterium]|jgi:hypothetical protein|nr:hypothetical protein [Oscillospiraceae bacterium]